MAGEAKRLGIYGFGDAAHIVTQVAVHDGRRVFAFTLPGDTEAQAFATEVGAEWAGSTSDPVPRSSMPPSSSPRWVTWFPSP